MGNEISLQGKEDNSPQRVSTRGGGGAEQDLAIARDRPTEQQRGCRDAGHARGMSSDNAPRLTFRSVYRLNRKIGEGSHSQVFLAVERATGHHVAVKAIHTDWLDRRRLDFLRAEIDIHQEVSVHPFVVRLLGIYDDLEACYIVEELAEGGSLLAHLHARSTMGSEDEVRLLLRRLLAAAQCLHDLGIVHRDIKPENILIMEDSMASAKLADFGFALRLNGQCSAKGPACGTPEYVAPEILLQQPFCGKADIWSIGVSAFCLLSGTLPFHGLTLDKLYTAILDGACSYDGADWARISPQGVDFVRHMLEVDQEDRWGAAQLLEHPWMKGGGGGMMVSKPTLGFVQGRGGGSDFAEGFRVRRPRVRLRGAVLAVMFANRLAVLATGRYGWGALRAMQRQPPQQHELGGP